MMPDGLATWLDDPVDTKLQPKSEQSIQHNKPHPRAQACEATAAAAAAAAAATAAAAAAAAAAAPPSTPTARQRATAIAAGSPNFPIIDVDAATPCTTTVRSGERTPLASSSSNTPALQTKAPWDPFAIEQRHAQHDDAFARLLQGRPSSKPKGARSAAVSPSLSSGSSPASTWDPFASSGEGKENGGDNAFSRLLASPGQGASGNGRGVLLKGRRWSAGKRKRPVGSSASGSSTSAGAEEDAATQFCECPVCGKRVIIELCSKHLDTECLGSDTVTDLSSSPPPAATDRPDPKSPTLSGSTAACAPSRRPTTEQRADTPTPPPPPRIGDVTQKTGSGIEQEGKSSHATPTSAAETPPVVDVLSGTGIPTDEGDEHSRKKLRSGEAVNGTSSSPAPAYASSGLELAVWQRKSVRGSAGAAAAAAGLSEAVISCPVCGQKVRADLCSRHLDTDCAGMSPADPPLLGTSAGGGIKKEGDGGSEKREEGVEATDRVAAEAKREKEASEAAGGLTALGAELTCPVCLCVFEDAHTLPCSHRFCLECITGCFRSSKRQECPLCKVPAWKRDLKRDVPLQNIIIAYRRMTA